MKPKYRAWNIKYKRMDEVATLNWLGDGSLGYNGRKSGEIFSGGVNQSGYDAEFVLLAYIGSNDKNEIEIYDGDVVRLMIYGQTVDVEIVNRLDTKNQYGHGCVSTSTFIGYSLSIDGKVENVFSTCEVIGNIYENPELLQSGRTP